MKPDFEQYKDIPGTTIFTIELARKGFWLNQFCMSLRKAENRERFLADNRKYLDEWEMTEEQKQAVIDREKIMGQLGANRAKQAAEEAVKNAKSEVDLARARSELAILAAELSALRRYREKKT